MKPLLRALVALSMLAAIGPVPSALAQENGVLTTEREKIGYMVGMDVGRSIAPAAPDLDRAAFERAVRNAFSGGQPLLTEEEAKAVAPALMQRIALRNGQPVPGLAPGVEPPAVPKDKVGFLVGADAGRSLAPIRDELDVRVFMQGVADVLDGRKLQLTDQEADALRQSFSARVRTKLQAEAAAAGRKNASEGAAFLARNKATKGVFTTPSGLQYMVLRQGAGPRPRPDANVRVHYHGTLLDGTVFDSSYDRGQPAEFGLDKVIAGWTEGLGLMPVGAKYRFWVPSELAYGDRAGMGPIGPNSTLVFDVELLQIL
ncbi:FKBP-type peptidyl-prolyl cis-trans isomerase [Luteimonas vadosa]|uniref:Peptidyl-prolyl cis-trans isomerase n=1 Tax=Luteimonas vadosa TaxID=1165507 RepID=A0ABP9E1W3_9GAMM